MDAPTVNMEPMSKAKFQAKFAWEKLPIYEIEKCHKNETGLKYEQTELTEPKL